MAPSPATSRSSSLSTATGPSPRVHTARRRAAVQPRASASSSSSDPSGREETSERMRGLKEQALSLWQGKRGEAELKVVAERSLMEARCQFMEEKIAAQNEYIRELSDALTVAKGALASAMRCLDADVALPELTHYIPSDQARHQEQEDAEEAACDAESFSNIENAMWAADVLLETSGVKLAEGSDLEESPK